ncbi:uncharacterized protein DUF2530 [Herbihabitans rhizosphaerae]|uniref:Uncharacterized protein DUF2530 n=1 Tax=Herbihabitans rhizosphaerae TaxID=1872711 RepID=A0A4Q7KW75_9PSEU|nr:DUF2530 domain-containing protein [Herbihabitans rhizosphaerae]RZS41004.1 uncharacterized protein DUF2530 [Herbihabitans rhizosphaerae]
MSDKPQRPVPPLPPSLTDLRSVVLIGTVVWFAAVVVLLVLRYGFDVSPPIWLWTAIAGATLGLIGVPIMWWQRTASRRGSKGAQRDL